VVVTSSAGAGGASMGSSLTASTLAMAAAWHVTTCPAVGQAIGMQCTVGARASAAEEESVIVAVVMAEATGRSIGVRWILATPGTGAATTREGGLAT
jgi:hypothetical protein